MNEAVTIASNNLVSSLPHSETLLTSNTVVGDGGALAAFGRGCRVVVAPYVSIWGNTAHQQGGAVAAFNAAVVSFDFGANIYNNVASTNGSIARVDTGGVLTFGRLGGR